ncbi:MAG: hypothetical protein PHU64_02275 [Candidatus Omnitrophica bacterium]|nr:hypothetical protein [Candidatus Omnitrophota bacterium]MDD5429903.1 hypothetical protein [Candidatus Omnitrophota bacterium]
MIHKKLDSKDKIIILRNKKKAASLGVREFADFLSKKYNIDISKSTLHSILKKHHFSLAPGPKIASRRYQIKDIKPCGLMLLYALDEYIGLSEHLIEELKVYFPKLSKQILKRIILLESLCFLSGKDFKENAKAQGFLRLMSLRYFPGPKIDYFNNKIMENSPTIGTERLRKSLELVATCKFYFKNGRVSYCDGKLTTFWEEPCKIDKFFLPLAPAQKIVSQMLANKTFILGYTKSFGYLSLLASDFIKGLESGLKNIEFLAPGGKCLKRIEVTTEGIGACFGYYPKIMAKTLVFLQRTKKFKRFFWPELGEFFASHSLIKFLQAKKGSSLSLHSILIKKDKKILPGWGLISTKILPDKKEIVASLLKQYLYNWPNTEENFLKDMEYIDKFLFKDLVTKNPFEKLVPKRLKFSQPIDFVRVGQILSIIFKEIVWGWEPKDKRGSLVKGKNYIIIRLAQVPQGLKKKFNEFNFYADGKRVFLA